MIKEWLKPRLRLWAIYSELGYIPWRKPHKERKRGKKGVYMGTMESIPFMNDDAKRTFSHLLLRPGYMIRDYIMRDRHEYYLAPITALLVFYSVFTLIVAIVRPGSARESSVKAVSESFDGVSVDFDNMDSEKEIKLGQFVLDVANTVRQAVLLTHLDQHPEAADTPWKESLAAVEGDLRGKGVPLFLGNFLMLWLAFSWVLRKYGVSISGAAAASAYVLCQFCIFMFLALVFSLGQKTELGLVLMGILLFIDYRQLLGLQIKPALKLTIRTGLIYILVTVVFYLLISIGIILFTYFRS